MHGVPLPKLMKCATSNGLRKSLTIHVRGRFARSSMLHTEVATRHTERIGELAPALVSAVAWKGEQQAADGVCVQSSAGWRRMAAKSRPVCLGSGRCLSSMAEERHSVFDFGSVGMQE